MIEWVVERLVSLMGPIATMTGHERDLRDHAIESILSALHETEIYYHDLGHQQHRSLATEAQLSRYWAGVAVPLRRLDQELAATCESHAHYWPDPDQWSSDDIQRLCDRIEAVSGAYQMLLTPKRYCASTINTQASLRITAPAA